MGRYGLVQLHFYITCSRKTGDVYAMECYDLTTFASFEIHGNPIADGMVNSSETRFKLANGRDDGKPSVAVQVELVTAAAGPWQ